MFQNYSARSYSIFPIYVLALETTAAAATPTARGGARGYGGDVPPDLKFEVCLDTTKGLWIGEGRTGWRRLLAQMSLEPTRLRRARCRVDAPVEEIAASKRRGWRGVAGWRAWPYSSAGDVLQPGRLSLTLLKIPALPVTLAHFPEAFQHLGKHPQRRRKAYRREGRERRAGKSGPISWPDGEIPVGAVSADRLQRSREMWRNAAAYWKRWQSAQCLWQRART